MLSVFDNRQKFLRLVFLYQHLINTKSKRKKVNLRRYWVKPHLTVEIRNALGAFRTLFICFKETDHEEFFKLTRMSPIQFEFLHSITREKLSKTSYREPLSTELRLAAVIVLLAQGNTIQTNAWLFRIGRSTMQGLLQEVCQVIIDVLVPICLPVLNEDTWKRISCEYQEMWNMPHCLGALDGRHMALKKPPHSGSTFFNYKKFFSMVLLGICDAHKRFTWFNVGHYGSFNDASIFMSTDLYRDMQQGNLNIPEPTILNGSNTTMPYFFVGDNIFALHKHLMKPYGRSEFLTKEQQIYNYRVSRARITIECAFGILVNRWKIFDRPLGCSLKTAEKVIIATLLLHNFIISQNLLLNDSASEYTNVNYHGSKKNYIDEQDARILEDSSAQREALKDYFNSPAGSVPWQEMYI